MGEQRKVSLSTGFGTLACAAVKHPLAILVALGRRAVLRVKFLLLHGRQPFWLCCH